MTATNAVLHPAAQPTNETRRQARRGLGMFFAVLIPLTAVLETLAIQTQNTLWYIPLMWTPALASLVARLVLREGPADVSFRLGGRRGVTALGLALVFPLLIGAVAYGLAWATGLASFTAPPDHPLIATITGGSASPVVQFGVVLLLLLTFGLLVDGIGAVGEEIGWRGYMLTRMIDAGVPAPLLTSGLIWGLWHIPLILAGGYAAGPSAALSVLIFLVAVTSLSVVYARLRLSTGSVWPAVLLHASWNSVILDGFDLVTSGATAKLWVGESGILIAVTLVVAALVAARGTWPMVSRLPQQNADQSAA